MIFSKKEKLVSALMGTFMSFSSLAGLPNVSAGNPLVKEGINVQGVELILPDSQNPSTLYVAPASFKKVFGAFQSVGMTATCDHLDDLRNVTYRMPEPDEVDKIVESRSFFSPLYQATIGIYASNYKILSLLIEKHKEASTFSEKYKDIYGAYTISKLSYETYDNELKVKRNEIADLKSAYSEELTLIKADVTMTAEDKEEMLAEKSQKFNEELSELSKEANKLSKKRTKSQKEFFKALEKWSPFERQQADMELLISKLEKDFNHQKEMVLDSFKRSQDVVEQLASRRIGAASAGFSLLQGEVEKVNNAIIENSLSYSTVPLPVFDVQMTTSNNLNISSSMEGVEKYALDFTQPYTEKIVNPTYDKKLGVTASSVERQVTASPDWKVYLGELKSDSLSSSALSVPVTLGGYCGHYKTVDKKYHVTNDNGGTQAIKVRVPVEDQNSINVMVEHVSVRYKYLAEADPINGTCEMDIKKFDDYSRNVGHKTSRRWFKKHTTSWDKTDRVIDEQMGINCSLTVNPQGRSKDPDQVAENLLRYLNDQMFALFLKTYVKSYTVEPLEAPPVPVAGSLSNVGGYLMDVCGKETYCKVGNFILKTMDELGGSVHHGSTSHNEHFTGKLKASFNQKSYRVMDGYSTVQMRVCPNYSNCQ